MTDELATHAWCVATGGALTTVQRRRLLRRSLVTYGEHVLDMARLALGRRARDGVTLPVAPDSELTRAAVAAAADQGPDVEGHGFRTWLFGGALAERDGVPLDRELFHVASICHDAGTARAVAGQDFTLRSAEVAVAAFASAGRPLDDARATALRDGVVAHATAGVRPADSAIGAYVQAGALLDLAGIRLVDMPAELVHEVFDRHPKGGVRDTIRRVIAAESDAVPDGRFAQSQRLGLRIAERLSPTLRG